MDIDSLPLGDPPPGRPPLRSYPILMAIFLCVTSNAFIDNAIARASPKAVQGRNLTSFGIIIQGIALVVLYAVSADLIARGLL